MTGVKGSDMTGGVKEVGTHPVDKSLATISRLRGEPMREIDLGLV